MILEEILSNLNVLPNEQAFQTIIRSTLDKDLLNATFLNIENLRRAKKRSSLSDLMYEVISSIEEPQREKETNV